VQAVLERGLTSQKERREALGVLHSAVHSLPARDHVIVERAPGGGRLPRGDAFHDTVAALHGEGTHRTGEVSPVERTPPWDDLL